MTELETWQPRNELAPAATAQDLAIQRLGEWAQSAQAAYQVATNLVRTSFVPEGFRNKPHEATAAILSGLEVGLSPMASLRSFDVIQGTAAPRAITLRAIVQSHGHEMELLESTTSRCVMRGRRRGSTEWQRVTWTIDRAKQLGVTGKTNWKSQPQAMLVARATSETARLIAADAILGIGYSAEEIADGGGTDTQVTADTTSAAPTGTRKMSRRKPAGIAVAPDPEPPPDVEETGLLLDTKSDLAKAMFASFNDAGITDRDQRLEYVTRVVDRTVDGSADMTEREAHQVLEALKADAAAQEEMDPTMEPDWGTQA